MTGAPDLQDGEDDASGGLLRTYLRALSFRFGHVTDGVPDGFGAFDAGAGVRTPGALVLHMCGLLSWVREHYEPGTRAPLEPLPFDGECARFLAIVQELDRVFAEGVEPAGDLSFEQLWRGPLIDAMTHVGQLATLRRLAGSPVERVRYWQVETPPVR